MVQRPVKKYRRRSMCSRKALPITNAVSHVPVLCRLAVHTHEPHASKQNAFYEVHSSVGTKLKPMSDKTVFVYRRKCVSSDTETASVYQQKEKLQFRRDGRVSVADRTLFI